MGSAGVGENKAYQPSGLAPLLARLGSRILIAPVFCRSLDSLALELEIGGSIGCLPGVGGDVDRADHHLFSLHQMPYLSLMMTGIGSVHLHEVLWPAKAFSGLRPVGLKVWTEEQFGFFPSLL